MPNITGHSLAMVAYPLLLPFVVSCTDFVTIPHPSQDHPPTITLSNFVSGGSGSVDQGSVTSDATVNVTCTKTRLDFFGSASNPVGGVKDFMIHVTNGEFDDSAHTTTTPDAQGRVPTNIAIFGTDGSGGAGSIPMEYTIGCRSSGPDDDGRGHRDKLQRSDHDDYRSGSAVLAAAMIQRHDCSLDPRQCACRCMQHQWLLTRSRTGRRAGRCPPREALLKQSAKDRDIMRRGVNSCAMVGGDETADTGDSGVRTLRQDDAAGGVSR